MYNYDKNFYAGLSENTGFHKDTLEKVHRLVIILEYMNSHAELKDKLALKGGTCVNLTLLNLARLSVDIDMDFCTAATRDEMLSSRESINQILMRIFKTEGYIVLPKSKSPHALDSWVIGYKNTSGNRDSIRVEINYSVRTHILPIEKRRIAAQIFKHEREINCIAATELYASKIAALLNRHTARDLCDLYNLIKSGFIKPEDYPFLKKCVVFYKSISDKEKTLTLSPLGIESISSYKVKTDLMPLLKKKEHFDLDDAKKQVSLFLKELLVLTDREREYINAFKKGKYLPRLLFEEDTIASRLENHPMALWKMQQRGRDLTRDNMSM